MGMFSRFRRRRTPFQATTDEERISRYVYLLGSLPAPVIEKAHAKAFADVPPERRREMFEQLRPFMADDERTAASDDPVVLARLLRRAEEYRARRRGGDDDGAAGVTTLTDRDPRDDVDARSVMLNAGIMALVAQQVLMSTAVALYFTQGAGSLMIDGEPGWVGATFDPAGSGVDGAGMSGGSDGGGYDGGGYDGGGFGGGFDGGGFGGGFDGGGF